jgi:Family of unknown function (DUF6263)
MAPSGVISNIVVGTEHSHPRKRLANVVESIRDASVVFPDVEIGVGATWRVTSQQTYSGVTWDRTIKYTLKAVSGGAATVVADITMRAGSQALSVEPNATTRLNSATGNATTELIIPLHGLVPTGMTQGTSEANFSIVRGHLRITSTVQSESSSSIKPFSPPTNGS